MPSFAQPSGRLASLVVIPAVLVVACTADETSRCLSTGDGEICVLADDGGATVTASGLEPGSEVQIETAETGSGTYRVGDAGTFDGAVGILAPLDRSIDVSVSGVDVEGEVIEGTIEIET